MTARNYDFDAISNKLDLYDLHVKEHELHRTTPAPISKFYPDIDENSPLIVDEIVNKRNARGNMRKTYNDVKLFRTIMDF